MERLRDLSFKKQKISLPLRSTIKDMGRAISHRALIVEHWLKGKEYEQINVSSHYVCNLEEQFIRLQK